MKYGELLWKTDHHRTTAQETGWYNTFALFLPRQPLQWISFPAVWPADLDHAGDKYKEEWRIEQMSVGIFAPVGSAPVVWYPRHGRFITLMEPLPLASGEYFDFTPLPANRMQNWEGYVCLERPVEVKYGVGALFHFSCFAVGDLVITDIRYRKVEHD